MKHDEFDYKEVHLAILLLILFVTYFFSKTRMNHNNSIKLKKKYGSEEYLR